MHCDSDMAANNELRIRFIGTLLGLDEQSRQHLLSKEPDDEIVKLTNLVSELSESLATAANKSPSFRELARLHGLQQLSEEKYRVNVKTAKLT